MADPPSRPKHPSGRPVKRDAYCRLPILRIPGEGPLTPGLRRRDLASAIGFRIERDSDDDE